ncbi:type II secretion system protein [Rheinheimera texasensis]|uniref:type II secretion system protein n=1 Tax=Rheinheimera texasensis TaxID=306205 RepID=UPI000A8E94CA|nr:prepilin-type N-terminal cleavage/methylation domain-containing protein [Rheinheimera texasensis]
MDRYSARALRGFTLIEVLLSTSILVMLLVLVAYAYQLFVSYSERRLSDFEQRFSEYRQMELVTGALRHLSSFRVLSASSAQQSGQQQNFGFYFLGRDEGFTAVTNNAISKAGALAVIRFFRENDENGKLRLVYEEALLDAAPLVHADQQLNFSKRVIVASNLENITFSYYAIDRNQVLDDTGVVKKIWYPVFDGIEIADQPEKLRVTIDQFDWVITLPAKTQSYKQLQADDV